jgi:NDP-sugar pyrophosphorylase family protein
MHVEVRSVTEDSSSAAAVAQLKDDLKAESFIVLSGDLVSDVPLKVHTTANLCFLTKCYSCYLWFDDTCIYPEVS